MKIYLKALALCFTFILLTGCEKDEIILDKNEDLKSKITIKQFQLNELDETPLFKKVFKKNFNNAKSSVEEMNDFTIDTNNIREIIYEDYTSYTIVIKRDYDTPNYFENLIIDEVDQGNTRTFIIKYIPTLLEEEIHGSFSFEGERTIEKIDYDPSAISFKSGNCYNTSEAWCNFGADHVAGPDCWAANDGRVYFKTIEVCDQNSGGDEPGTGGSTQLGGNAASGSEPVITTPQYEDGTTSENITNGYLDGSLNDLHLDFLINNPALNIEINMFLNDNRDATGNIIQEAKDFANNTIDVLTQTDLSLDASQENLTLAVFKMTKYLKEFGEVEDEFIAEYIESIVPNFVDMSRGEVYDIFNLTREYVQNLEERYARMLFDEAVLPFMMYALTEATLGAALPLISKIPLSMVLRGARLNKMVKRIGLLGVRGSSNNIRVVTTSSPITKSKELFNSLTKDAISKTTQSNGAIVANVGNGNTITYRTINQSSSGFEASIDLNFTNIWSQVRTIKFK